MEGIAGVVTEDQLGTAGFEYVRFREFMTNEVLAAIEGARAAGATEFVVADSHGNGESLLFEKFARDTLVVRAWPRPLAMMQGIDETFTAAMFIGYHTSTTNPAGVRAHTFSSANLADVRLNGVSVPEAGLNAAVAGSFRVPVVLVTGDDAIAREASGLIPGIEVAVVKWAYGFHSAKTMTPAAACDLIREKARVALSRAKEIRPLDGQDAGRARGPLQELPSGRAARVCADRRARGRPRGALPRQRYPRGDAVSRVRSQLSARARALTGGPAPDVRQEAR